ncbi:MAG: efflux RND transporter permease subunit [Rhodospirillaceae bacterium]|nr:MAG: efflux RND transporter permease subunit [Rhodospirillaceae bacterium]
MTIIDAALSRSRTVIALLTLILIAGFSAYVNIPKEARPDVNIPIIYVSMSLKGISPEDAERLLVRPMESELQSIEGIKEMRSSAYLGGANVLLEFEAGFNADQALNDVRERADIAEADLPEDAEEPRVEEVNLSLFPIIIVTLGGEVPERTLLKIGRDLQEKVKGISAVLEANIGGDRDEQVEIVIDPLLLDSYGLDPRRVLDAISRSNRLIAAGSLDGAKGSFAVKVPGLLENVSDILDMPLKSNGDSVVTVRDLASVRRTFEDRETYARLNGEPAISLEVKKRTGENIVETVNAVKALVEQERKDWPAAITVTFSGDDSRNIRNMLTDLQNNVLSAVLLVMIIIVAALGVRTGILVGVAIPGSFLTGILVLGAFGLTVNIVVLFALILSVGLLVDGAIVVTEYADRKMIEGAPRTKAYAEAAKRMSWPIIASTATTLAAFLPLLFWPGIVGEFMKFLPITLIATLIASLAMALVFVPTLGAQIGKPGGSNEKMVRQMSAMETGDINNVRGFTGLYIKCLSGVLRHPSKVVFLAVVSLISAWVMYANFGRGFEFFPSVEPDRAVMKVSARGNLSVDEKAALVADVENHILDIQRERGELSAIYTRSGKQQRRDDAPIDIIGTINLEFADWDTRRKADEILADIVQRSQGLAGIYLETAKEEAGPPVGKPIHMLVTSRHPETIEPAVAKIREKLNSMPGLKDIEDGRPVPGIEWEMAVDRAQASKFDADVTVIGNIIRLVTNGLKVSEFQPDDADDEIDIVIRYPEDKRTLGQLDRTRVQTPKGLIPLSNFVQRVPRQQTSELRRTDARRSMTVKADVLPGVLADNKNTEIHSWLKTEANLDPRVQIEFKGEDKEQKKASAFLGRAFGIALFLMAIILVTQFNRFYSAFLILSAVIMSTVGVMLGLLIIEQPFGIVMSGIGVIALAGIVVNNNIVLIDTFDRVVKTAASPREAIIRTGAQRLRPVLLTTATTIFGVLPMVTRVNIDFVTREIAIGAPSTQWWQQLSTAIAFGLAFATLLTMFVTPSLLMIRANVSVWRELRRKRCQTAQAVSAQ